MHSTEELVDGSVITGMQPLRLANFKDVACMLHNSPPSEIEDFLCILHQCGKQRDLWHALHLHAYTCERGLETHALLGNSLMEMMVKVGAMVHAEKIFNRLPFQEECAWNCLIIGYVDCGELKHALFLYEKMRENNWLHPSAYTFVTLLKACTRLKDVQRGHDIFEDVVREGLLEGNIFLGSTLVNMYAKCGLLSKAEDVFDKLLIRNIVLWNSLIAGYSEHGLGEEAIQCLDRMQHEGIFPDAVTLVCGLKACSSLGATNKGREIHTQINRLGLLERDIFVGNALIDMYSKIGFFDKAQELFRNLPSRNVVSWNALMVGLASYGHGEEVITCFEQMQQEAIPPDAVTLVCTLKACGSIGAIVKGREIHCEVTKKGLLETDVFTGSALVDMYTKFDSCETACYIFNVLPFRDTVCWNVLVAGQVDLGHGKEALVCIERMRRDGICTDSITLVGCLRACGSTGATYNGQECHTEIVNRGLESDPLIGSALVDMYFKNSLLVDAHQVFEELPNRFVVAWNAVMSGYVAHGHSEKALEWFEQMQKENVCCDALTFISSLKACGNIRAVIEGQEMHAHVVKAGFLEDVSIGSTFVYMYSKCGLLIEAQGVFDKLSAKDVVSWTALISGYVEHGWSEEALCCFEQMQREGISPGAITLGCSLKACSNLKSVRKGQAIHVRVVQKGLLEQDSFLCSALVDMYAKCESLVYAQDVFNKLPVQDLASWTALMLGFLEYGDSEEALYCFEQMQQRGVSPGSVTLVCSMKACASIPAGIIKAREIHSEVLRKGLENDLFVGNALVDMYSKCGTLEEAQIEFNRPPDQDVFSWAALISGYADHGDDEEAICCFEQMQLEGVSPCAATVISCMKACGSIRAVAKGRELHAESIRKGYDNEIMVGNTLVEMYGKCGLLAEAQKVFDSILIPSVVVWNVLIQAHTEHKSGKEAINLVEEMQRKGVSPDFVTLICSLRACGMTRAIMKGQDTHAEIVRKGLEREPSICNTLVDMYAKCGFLTAAQETFNKLSDPDAVSWTALISGHVGHGHGEAALDCFEQMQHESMLANAVTLVCCLKACGSVGAAGKGSGFHVEIAKKGLEREVLVGNTLVDMYGKCGLLAMAQEVFDKLPVRDLVSWNALIAGYAQLGESESVFHIFGRMLSDNVKPSPVTFISVLNVCSHSGLLDKSQECFDAISSMFNLTQTLEHYTCIIDTLGRAGHIDKAIAMTINMPLHPGVVVWHTVLGACLKGANMELARHAFEHAVRLDEKDCAAYICLSNIYALAALQQGD